MIQFRVSLQPSVQVWKAVKRRLLIIWMLQISLQKANVIQESRLEITPSSVLKRHSTFLKNYLARLTIVVSLRVGINKAYFVIQYTIVSILLYVFLLRLDLGKPIIQSRLISLKGLRLVGKGRGLSLPYGLCQYIVLP